MKIFYTINLSPTYLVILHHLVIVSMSLISIGTLVFYSHLMIHFKHTLENILRIYPISNREAEVVLYVTKGQTNKEIADTLFIEESTVKRHLNSIYKKLDISNRTQLVTRLTATE